MKGRGGDAVAAVGAPLHVFQLGVFIFVTVGAEKLPVAAIGWVVVVVIVLVMDFQQRQIGVIEGARTTTADPGKQFQSLGPVTLLSFFGAATRLEDKSVKSLLGLCHRSQRLLVHRARTRAARIRTRAAGARHHGRCICGGAGGCEDGQQFFQLF